MKRTMKARLALAAAVSLLQFPFIPAACAGMPGDNNSNWQGEWNKHPVVTAQPNAGFDVKQFFNDPDKDPNLPKDVLVKLLQDRIKYVFVIFNENHSFDNEYGTFPGVNGIYSDGVKPRSASDTPGFTQTYTDNVSQMTVTVQPFRIGPGQNSTVVDSVDHSHNGLWTKIDVNQNGVAQMDKFAYREYTRFAGTSGTPTAANEEEGTQFARLVMSHIDCDTIPFFWMWASRFTIFDNIFATEDTPSSPNAIAMIAGQAGETQWVKHPNANGSITVGSNSGTLNLPPLSGDPQPFWGSQFDTTAGSVSGDAPYIRQPLGTKREGFPFSNNGIAANLTFASLPLTFQGGEITTVLMGNMNPAFDLPDIQQDIPYIQKLNTKPVKWGWYQEGYGLEVTDTNGVASHNSYVSHHNGAQYFGYISDTPEVSANLHGLSQFFTDISNKDALKGGGVFYIRGGYNNLTGKNPVITNPNTPADEITAINAVKAGDDDHPSYTDRQLSEAMAARVINSIASNPEIWQQCAIIITYDESDGFYDHVPPRILSYGPDSKGIARGVRVPLILISPFARAHAVSHAEGDHNAIIETINSIFGLPALASLPDEAQALAAGNSTYFNQFAPAGFEQKFLGPRDINSSITDSLLSGFDPRRLMGEAPPIPAWFAMIPDEVVSSFPHFKGHGCCDIGIVPEDVRQNITNTIPGNGHFNPLPSTYPTTSNPDAITF